MLFQRRPIVKILSRYVNADFLENTFADRQSVSDGEILETQVSNVLYVAVVDRAE